MMYRRITRRTTYGNSSQRPGGTVRARVSRAAASAQESVYKGKQVVILVSADAGTSYDLYPRIAARHIGKYIPGTPRSW